jgi:hypothetical protein
VVKMSVQVVIDSSVPGRFLTVDVSKHGFAAVMHDSLMPVTKGVSREAAHLAWLFASRMGWSPEECREVADCLTRVWVVT